jgi:hypothetical protein
LGKNKIARVVKNTNECGFNRWPINWMLEVMPTDKMLT